MFNADFSQHLMLDFSYFFLKIQINKTKKPKNTTTSPPIRTQLPLMPAFSSGAAVISFGAVVTVTAAVGGAWVGGSVGCRVAVAVGGAGVEVIAWAMMSARAVRSASCVAALEVAAAVMVGPRPSGVMYMAESCCSMRMSASSLTSAASLGNNASPRLTTLHNSSGQTAYRIRFTQPPVRSIHSAYLE